MIWTDEDIKKLASAVADELERRETEKRRLNEEYRAEFWKLLKEFNKNENPFPDRREEGKGKIMCKDCGEWLKDAKSGLPVFLNQADQMMYVAGKLNLPLVCSCDEKPGLIIGDPEEYPRTFKDVVWSETNRKPFETVEPDEYVWDELQGKYVRKKKNFPDFISEYMNTHDTEGRPLQTDTKMKFSFPMSLPLNEDGDFRESIIRRIFRGALK